jgi:hypothetical protein
MTRMLAFVAALLLTAITVSSACVASSTAPLQFTIQPRNSGEVHIRFSRERNGHSESNWESSFPSAELGGLDLAALNAPGTRPLQFALVREAGRVDCAGTGGNQMARGTCTLTPNADFDDFLASNGIGAPNEDQTFGLMALNVRRDLVTALARARYPVPTVEKLVEVTAVGVTPAYIDALSRVGYRPPSLDELVQFAALKITPDYVLAVQQGGALPSPDHLVQLRAVTRDLRNR